MEELFETKGRRGGTFHKLFSLTMFVSILLIWTYRFLHVPQSSTFPFLALLAAEILFGLYWIIAQAGRWHVVYRFPFKDRLSARYEDKLPRVDVFVCTADPQMEPPSMVIATILSVMSYNYPPEKLAVYLSDDGGSEFTFYALFEASKFARSWIPFCKKYNVEPRSPDRYFSQSIELDESDFSWEWTRMKELYHKMKNRIDSTVSTGRVPEAFRGEHKGFAEWNSKVTKQDHQSIVQILIDGWNCDSVDAEGNGLPTLVYVSREKKPGWQHNFKAGAMNALIRVSAEISNAPIILNVDCDMYANDPDAIRNALCFFLDEKHGQQTSYVQYPQYYYNLVENDVYANVNLPTNAIELCGLDGYFGAPYIGTGCFHRRESLSGKKYSGSHMIKCLSVEDTEKIRSKTRTVEELENNSKALATCSYEKGSLWGREMGLVYGCAVEDMVTGLTIQCRGWKPIYHNPNKHAFKGVAPTTLDVSLVQFKRWSEGMFQVFFSKYCPFIYGHGKIALGAQIGYCIYLLWAPVSFPTLCYVIIPALCSIHDTPVFPEISSSWFVPFAYFFVARSAYTLVEDVILGNTVMRWWMLQRMILVRRTTAFLFAFFDTVAGQLGLSQTSFALTAKVEDEEARRRYEKGIIDFKGPPVMMTIVATVALVNLVGLGRGLCAIVWGGKFRAEMVVCGAIVILCLPVYEAMLWRRDAGRISTGVVVKAVVAASLLCLIPMS